jgi:hypothetical protein
MSMIDQDRFIATPLAHDPYDHLVMEGFVGATDAAAAAAAFPGPDLPGVLPAPSAPRADAFGRLLDELRSPWLTGLFAQKFGLPLTTDTLMITLRARCRPQDGKIHTDSETKVVTALVYLNDDWSGEGGRLRVLRSNRDLDDMAAEVPPVAGTLIAFRRSDHSWHGHKPFDGPRKAIMVNWMVDAAAARRELRRHAISAGVKSIFAAQA